MPLIVSVGGLHLGYPAVLRFNCRIDDGLQNHRFQSGEGRKQIILRDVTLYNQSLPESVFAPRTSLQAMNDLHKLRPELLKKQPR